MSAPDDLAVFAIKRDGDGLIEIYVSNATEREQNKDTAPRVLLALAVNEPAAIDRAIAGLGLLLGALRQQRLMVTQTGQVPS